MKNTRDVFIFKKNFVKAHISLIYKGISGAEILSDRQGPQEIIGEICRILLFTLKISQ